MAQIIDEPIAIVGMGCRFSGPAGKLSDTPDRFWELLVHGVDTITPIPASRWDVANIDRIVPNYGGFLHNVDLFDASFFNVAPKEAVMLDPQQRRLLEVSWEAIENAGINPTTLRGSDMGVFVGISSSDYQMLQVKQFVPYRKQVKETPQ